jgi:recombinational DNA repair protein RecT
MSNLSFRIIGIKTDQFAIIEDNFTEKKKSEVTTDLEFKANNKNKQIGVFTTFTFKSANKPFIILQISCIFEIEEPSWKEYFDENKIVFPKDFMTHLTMMTIGTARGILHSKTEGTPFNRFVLPTIKVPELVTDDVEFTFED